MPTGLNVKVFFVMKKQGIIKLLASFLVVVIMLTTFASCSELQGIPGKDGADGKDGVTPTIEISEDGYWIINGVKTEYKAIGEDGVGGSCDCDACEHSYVLYFVLESTCTSHKLLLTCEYCHNVISSEEDPIVEHTYEAVVTLPTCTEGGYTTYTCNVCGDSYVGDFTDALGHNYENDVCTRCGELEPKNPSEYIYFGEYPQTIKADDVTITTTVDDRGYYLGSDGFYYAKVTAFPYGKNYTFSTGSAITSREVYYFKVEPIRWRILSTDGETAFILCDSIIANMPYQWDMDGSDYTTANGAPEGTYASNYKYSGVRRWLNETFYETAFTELQKEMILTTTVDNSVESTGLTTNPYVCEDTEDKVFLLSQAEVTNNEYGFSSGTYDADHALRISTSDYSRATGVMMVPSASFNFCGDWWLRSPNGKYFAVYVSYAGNTDEGVYTGYNYYGIVPAMWINLNP